MKNLLTTCILLFITAVSIGDEIKSGRVVKITDGDTITILVAGTKEVKIRLYGIDCPEKKQDFSTQAKKFTSSLCFKQIVKVQAVDTDRYGRTVAIVKLLNGQILNEELLNAGLAWHYAKHESERYALLEKRAREKHAGIWSAGKQVAPWEFRRAR